VSFQECPEDGALFKAAFNHAQEDGVVVEEIYVDLQSSRELNEQVPETFVGRPTRETVPYVLNKFPVATPTCQHIIPVIYVCRITRMKKL